MNQSLNQAQRNVVLVAALLLVMSILFLPYKESIEAKAIGSFLDPRPPQGGPVWQWVPLEEEYTEWGVAFLPWGLPKSGMNVRNYKMIESQVQVLWPVLVVEWVILAIAVAVGMRMFASPAAASSA